jgi:hypothetical protein
MYYLYKMRCIRYNSLQTCTDIFRMLSSKGTSALSVIVLLQDTVELYKTSIGESSI